MHECRKEKGFNCRKYHGNVMNYMNSVTVVETDGSRPLHYIAVVLSNVLKKNSQDVHISVAQDVHQLIRASNGP